MPLAEPMGGLRAVGTAAGVCEADISLKGQCAPPGPSLALPAEVVKVRDGMVGIPRWKQSHRGYLGTYSYLTLGYARKFLLRPQPPRGVETAARRDVLWPFGVERRQAVAAGA